MAEAKEIRVRVRGYPAGVPCWTQLSTPDPEASIGFYTALFDWTMGTDRIFRVTDRAAAGLVEAPGQPAGWLVYVATDDVEESVGGVLPAGGTLLSQPFDAPPGGRAALLRDPAGAVFGVWQRITFGGAQVAGEPSVACWVDLATTDLAGAESFYGKVFGWTAGECGYAEAGSGYLEFSVGARAVAGLRALPPELTATVPAHWMVTFDVLGHAEAVARCVEMGGQVLFPPQDVGVGTYAQLLDPHGAAFGLIELSPALRQLA